MLTIGREGKRQEFETVTHEEVLKAIGSAYCSLKRLGKHHKQNADYRKGEKEVGI